MSSEANNSISNYVCKFMEVAKDTSAKAWTHMSEFTHTHKREIFVTIFLAGLVLLAFSSGAAIAAGLSGSLQAGKIVNYTTVVTYTTTAGEIFIKGLIGSIIGAALFAFGAGGLSQMEHQS